MQIRLAGESDIEDIRSVGKSAWWDTYTGLRPEEYIQHALDRWWSRDYLQGVIASRGGLLLVAEESHQIVGVAESQVLDDQRAMLWKLYVLKEHRGQGIGTALIQESIQRLPSGVQTYYTEYDAKNKSAAAFYRSRGFVVDRIEEGDFRDVQIASIYVKRALKGTEAFSRPVGQASRFLRGSGGVIDMAANVIPEYLDLLDSQREAVFAALDGLSEEQIWQRPAPKEWCAGEILSHTARFLGSFLPGLQFMWAVFGWYGRLRRTRPYAVEIENVYKRPNFPMWTGFLWTPRHNPKKPVPLAALKAEVESTHKRVRQFYTGKDPDVLGNIYAYDPAIGVVNLITALKVGIDHDQLHYDDLFRMARTLPVGG